MSKNKQTLVDAVNNLLGGTKADAERAVDAVFNTLTDAMKADEQVNVAGFGIFAGKERKARTARNPKTGEPVQVPAMRVPKFRPAKALKEAVKG